MPAVFNAKVNDAFNEWSKGYGKIQHTSSTMIYPNTITLHVVNNPNY